MSSTVTNYTTNVSIVSSEDALAILRATQSDLASELKDSMEGRIEMLKAFAEILRSTLTIAAALEARKCPTGVSKMATLGDDLDAANALYTDMVNMGLGVDPDVLCPVLVTAGALKGLKWMTAAQRDALSAASYAFSTADQSDWLADNPWSKLVRLFPDLGLLTNWGSKASCTADSLIKSDSVIYLCFDSHASRPTTTDEIDAWIAEIPALTDHWTEEVKRAEDQVQAGMNALEALMRNGDIAAADTRARIELHDELIDDSNREHDDRAANTQLEQFYPERYLLNRPLPASQADEHAEPEVPAPPPSVPAFDAGERAEPEVFSPPPPVPAFDTGEHADPMPLLPAPLPPPAPYTEPSVRGDRILDTDGDQP